MDAIIEIKNLTKHYGKFRGIENLNLKVRQGEIFGFLGPNGAGKTTTIKILLHLINPTSGNVFIFGKNAKNDYVKISKNVGYLASDLNLYDKMTGKELLSFSMSFYKRDDISNYRKNLIEKLDCDLKKPFKELSSGNKQKIGILVALFHKPKLLILDEPTSGLDPLAQNALYGILLNLKKEGTTVFFSSHNLPEVEKVCDRIGIIREGELVDVETIDEVRSHRRKEAEIYFKEPYKKEDFTNIKGIEVIEARDNFLNLFVKNIATNSFLSVLASYKIKDVNFAHPDLENVFLKYYEKGKDEK